jgi:hypothetical protein
VPHRRASGGSFGPKRCGSGWLYELDNPRQVGIAQKLGRKGHELSTAISAGTEPQSLGFVLHDVELAAFAKAGTGCSPRVIRELLRAEP